MKNTSLRVNMKLQAHGNLYILPNGKMLMSETPMILSDDLAALKINRSRKKRRVSPWIWVVLLGIVTIVFLAPQILRGLQDVEVTVATAVNLSATTGKPVDGSPELTAAGYVVADRQSVLAAKFTGRLARLNVAEADFVKKGDIIAEIDHSELDATIVQAEAEVAEAAAEVQRLSKLTSQAEAELAAAKAPLRTLDAEIKQYEILLTDARRRLEIDINLLPHRAVTNSEVDDRRTEVSGAQAKIAWTQQRKYEAEQKIVVSESQIAVARAAIALAEARQRTAAARVKVLESQRDESFIRSPFDGMVTEKAAEVGEIVAPISIGGSMARGSIVTVADWTSLQAEVDVAEAQLGRVKAGQRAAITVDAIPGSIFPGKLRRILPARIAARRRSKSASISLPGTTKRFSPRWACEFDFSRTMPPPVWKQALSEIVWLCPRRQSKRAKTAVSYGL